MICKLASWICNCVVTESEHVIVHGFDSGRKITRTTVINNLVENNVEDNTDMLIKEH